LSKYFEDLIFSLGVFEQKLFVLFFQEYIEKFKSCVFVHSFPRKMTERKKMFDRDPVR